MIRGMFEDMPIVSSIIAIIILGLTFLLIDGIASKPDPFYGKEIILTGDHLVCLPDLNCYRKVENLSINDNVLLK